MGNPNNRRSSGQGTGLRKVPGFRSDTLWKKAIAIIIYFLLALVLISMTAAGGIAGVISFIAMLTFIISSIALIAGKLLLVKIPNRKIAGGILIASFILFMVSAPSTEEVQENADLESSNTEEAEKEEQQLEAQQKAAEEKQQAEEQAAAEKAEKEQLAKEAEEEQKAQEAKEAEEARKAAEAKKAEEARLAKEAEEERKAQAAAEKAAQEKAAAEKKKQDAATNATVTRVVDGDTLEVSMNGQTETIRLLLIDTPETVHPQKPVEPFGPEASDYVKDTLTGQAVRVVVGKEARDNYGRLLAYVYIGNETIQEKLLRNGLAATAYLYNDLTMLDRFHQVQQTAIDAKKGVWSIPGYAHVDHDHGFHYEEQKPEPEVAPAPTAPTTPMPNTGLQYDPNGPDRDCGDFSSQAAAQAFMEASGPGDPHRLDGNDNDGLACESL